MRYYIQLAVAVVCGGFSTGLVADDSQARVLLDQMSHSFRELNYRGALSYQHGDTTQSLRITHAVIDGEEYERLEYMDGERREIIRSGHNISCIHPGHHLVRLYHQRHNLTQSSHRYRDTDRAQSQQDFTDYYTISLVGEDRVAGRDAVELLLSPKDTHRLVHRLSLDKQTGLLLRSIVEGDAGKILERFQFADIQIGGEISADYFQVNDYSYQAEHIEPVLPEHDQLSTMNAKQSWLVNWLPGGFTTVVANQRFASDDMVTFTDGLAVFSVFLEKVDKSAGARQKISNSGEGHARHGATIAYTRRLLLAGVEYRVTVVGEIPQQTARQVAQSVALAQ